MANGELAKAEDADGSDEAKAIEEFEQRPTTMPDIGVDLDGFATEDVASVVGQEVLSALHVYGKLLNLKRLLRVRVSYNYHQALAEVERGTTVTRPLTATNDEIAVGIAMTPKVLHEGEPRCVMVLNAAHMSVFAPNDNPEIEALRREMLYTLAHECAHVHDLDVQAVSFPGAILKTMLPFRDGILFYIASACWEEYIACRLSAFAGTESTLRWYEDTFCLALERAKGRADAAIRQYRMHHDVTLVSNQVAEEYKKVLVYASYMLGHLDGLDTAVEEAAPKALKAIASQSYFEPFFYKLRDELRALHSRYHAWKALDVFDPLKHLAYEVLKVAGVDIQSRPDGAGYVDIPFTPETTPSLQEQAAFMFSKRQGESA